MSKMQVANTILEQLGGGRFLVMTGAKNLVGDHQSLGMKINGRNKAGRAVNKVSITLAADDTYTVQTWYFRGMALRAVDEMTGVYCDQLRAVFTSFTGLHTSLGTMGR